jgi:hypothetical protein
MTTLNADDLTAIRLCQPASVFEGTRPTYWSVLHERAWAKPRETLGFNLRTALLAAGSVTVGGGLHAWLKTGQAAVERISVGSS